MTHEVGYDKGYMQAEKDYFDRTEKDRQASYDAGYEIGKADMLKEIIQQLINSDLVTFSQVIVFLGDKLEELREQKNDGYRE